MNCKHAECLDVADYYRRYFANAKTNVALLWEAASFLQSEGEPMTVRRALALNAVLANSFLVHCPGDLLVGSGNLGRLAAADFATPDEFAKAKAVTDRIGRRSFAVFASHHAPDYPGLVAGGLPGLRRRLADARGRLDEKGRIFLASLDIALAGAELYLQRWAAHLHGLAAATPDFAALLAAQAQTMKKLVGTAPETFHEALQLVLAFHHMFQLDRRGAMAFGRMDQFLYPFYRRDLDAGRTDVVSALELLNHFFAKITVDGDVQNIALAGVRPEDGEDATNELSCLFLDACARIGRPGGNCSARIDWEKTPRAFVRKCAEVIRTGIGYPAVMNDQLTVSSLVACGYPLEDARDCCFVGCIETFIPGRQAPWSDSRLNPLERMRPAVDWLVANEEKLAAAEKFPAFYAKFVELVGAKAGRLLTEDNARQAPYQEQPENFTSPLLSLLVRDCIERGRDMNDGGAIYPANKGYGIMGIASVADALAAVKKLVCESGRFSARALTAMLDADFNGFEPERRELLAAPKFGNADPEVDGLAADFMRDLAKVFARHRNAQGGFYWMLMASNVQNIPGGKEVGATPEGRRAGEPLSDASSPYFGRDRKGPTAAIRSIASLPYHLATGGNVVNMKLDPASIAGAAGLDALASLILTCFKLGGSELQFNTTDRQTLQAAMENPELYGNLVVRVSGFSYNYTWLAREVQQDILNRTEHRV